MDSFWQEALDAYAEAARKDARQHGDEKGTAR